MLCQKYVSRTGARNHTPQYLWDVIIFPYPWYLFLLYQKQASRAGTSNHIPLNLWGVIICPCPWYLILVQHSWYITTTKYHMLNSCGVSLHQHMNNAIGSLLVTHRYKQSMQISCWRVSDFSNEFFISHIKISRAEILIQVLIPYVLCMTQYGRRLSRYCDT